MHKNELVEYLPLIIEMLDKVVKNHKFHQRLKIGDILIQPLPRFSRKG